MAEMSYEAARDELQKVVATLESGGLGLEESLKLWERGEELAAICQEWLDGAKAKLESASQLASKAGQDDEG
jgi:exodeoxyribonuclease VII small subunit